MNISTNYIAEGVIVVIPEKKKKNYISDAVGSIKKQPYKKIFIIQCIYFTIIFLCTFLL